MHQLIRDLRAVPGRFQLLAGAVALVLLVSGHSTAWNPFLELNNQLELGAALAGLTSWVLAAAPVVALRAPAVAAGLGLAPLLTALLGDGDLPWVLYPSLLLVAMASTWRSAVRGLLIAVASLAPVLAYALGGSELFMPFGGRIASEDARDPASEVIAYSVVSLLAWVVALRMRAGVLRDEQTRSLEARAGEVETRSAVLGERARLARDLHDVVAHHVSLIAVRAETAAYTVPDLSPGGRTLLAEIADDSRRALDELRGVLGILRRSGEDPSRAPQPTAGDIASLVGTARAAGEQVDWQPADLGAVLPGVGYAAYRVVQEALTNARRHAPGAPVLLRTVPDLAGGLSVRIGNPAPGTPVGEGRGLSGMRERVEALGGSLHVEHADGSVVVEATIPGSGT